MTPEILAEIDAMNRQTRRMVQQSLDRPMRAVMVPVLFGTVWAAVVIGGTAWVTMTYL